MRLPLDWTTESHAQSPDGRITAYHLASRSEAGDAPYGDHIVLASSYLPFGQYYGQVVFAGYCESGPKYVWKTERQLQISCETDTVKKRIETFKEVQIEYQIIMRKPHNQALLRRARKAPNSARQSVALDIHAMRQASEVKHGTKNFSPRVR